MEKLQNEAKTVIFAAYDGKLIGILALADTLKEYAEETISELKKRISKFLINTKE